MYRVATIVSSSFNDEVACNPKTSKIEKASIKIAQAGKIFLKNVKVTKDSILPNTDGWKSVYSCINKARYGIAWGVMGAAEDCWYRARQYTCLLYTSDAADE